ncbi:hypothetical protein ES332_D08G024600v1 [Gossypium tomentosum]|uniref:Uncharacterized protein n=1 Tax=Gossypium tomentosum TaxID=34277 RepID=A0A5D2JNV3_GOSTO|nr:hypothetical protein ES332_D08G024600v1 [Gossypium tomentosum]
MKDLIKKQYFNCGNMFEILFEEPVPLPVMAALAAIFAILHFSSPRCACTVVNSTTVIDVGTTKIIPRLGARWVLLLVSLLLVIVVRLLSSSPSYGGTATEKGLFFNFSWVLLSVFNVFVLYMAVKQQTFRKSLFLYYFIEC